MNNLGDTNSCISFINLQIDLCHFDDVTSLMSEAFEVPHDNFSVIFLHFNIFAQIWIFLSGLWL